MASSSRGTLNIPRGNSTITADPAEDELQSGDRVQDYKKAFKRLDLKHDFENIEQIPCIRQALLSGIGGGVGIGAVRYLGSRSPRAGANWAVASFVVISIFQWNICNNERRRQLTAMRAIQERFPHLSKLRKQQRTQQLDSEQKDG